MAGLACAGRLVKKDFQAIEHGVGALRPKCLPGLQRIEEHDAGALYVEQLILSAGNRLKAPLDKVPKHGLHPGASVVVARNHANGHRKPP